MFWIFALERLLLKGVQRFMLKLNLGSAATLETRIVKVFKSGKVYSIEVIRRNALGFGG